MILHNADPTGLVVVSSKALAGGVMLVANRMIVVVGFGVTRDTDGLRQSRSR
jgi:hypothetical protein